MKDYTFEVDYTEEFSKENLEKLFTEIIEECKKTPEGSQSEDGPLFIFPEKKKKFNEMVGLMEAYCKEYKKKGKCVISREREKASFYIYTGCFHFEVTQSDDVEYKMLKCIANNSDYFLVSVENGELVVEASCWYFN